LLTYTQASAGGDYTTAPTISQASTAPVALTKSFNPALFATGPLDFFGGDPYWAFGSVVRAKRGTGFTESRYETIFDGSSICFYLENSAYPSFTVLAGNPDGPLTYVKGTGGVTLLTTANGVYVTITFPSRGIYRVAIEREYQSGIQGLYIEPTAQAWRPNKPHITALVVGDSITGGTGASFYGSAWEYVTGRALGWDIWSDGVGGSGYLAGTPFSDPTRTSLLTLKPFDVVVIAGGINDANATNAPGVQSAAASYFASVRAALPNALIVVLGAWAGSTGPSTGPNSVSDVESKIKAAFNVFADFNSVFIPVSTDNQPWIYGTGHVAAPAGSGNADLYVGGLDGTDLTHPNDAGHSMLGKRCATALRGALGF
jgi:lysophospholipase L1-like esterase